MSPTSLEPRIKLLPDDHTERFVLANEVHARPPQALAAPAFISHVALVLEPEDRAIEKAHLGDLCLRLNVVPPAPEAIHFNADLGSIRLIWERHAEFSSFTFIRTFPLDSHLLDGLDIFDDDTLHPIANLPHNWLCELPGKTIFAAHALLISGQNAVLKPDFFTSYFLGNMIVGSGIGSGSGAAFSDFRIHKDGFSRFVILDHNLSPYQAGRTVQRLFEIETYRVMAMLALPMARRQSKQIIAMENALAKVTDDITNQNLSDEALLKQLSDLAVEVENCLALSQFRFGACKAYHDLVIRRIAELREQRQKGFQTLEDFMSHRFTPAVATCASTSQRLRDLSERVAQASGLLSTRVDIARSRQNQMLLASMNRRAKLQLDLQKTVEVLSVIPITYYIIGLIAYLTKGLKIAGLVLSPEIVEAVSLPIILGLALLVVKFAHKKALTQSQGVDSRGE